MGHYSVPIQGSYFLEVFGLFSNGPQWKASASFRDFCMGYSTVHCMTKDTIVIDFTIASQSRSEAVHGYWKWSLPYLHNTTQNQTNNNKDGNDIDIDNENKNHNNYTKQQPLLTRYQPKNY